ncbi:transglutaminase family protein [Sagittula salina]|uniref:Transglutaminase family protein n=1 Tax=Sagittula salina TaxID=2820268 RepID=A0A940MK09_9RHOB|nr:transglutaminase family protein [Sagittula salina]MBP0481185.1 transglutaminase family protein [Sagittula salina]
MIYDLTLAIRYRYESRATAARTLLRMVPMDNARQQVLTAQVSCVPEPAMRSEEVDFFGNAMVAVTFAEPLSEVTFRLKARVRRHEGEESMDLSPSLSLLANDVAAETSLGPESPHHFTAASERVSLGGEIGVFASRTTQSAPTALQAVRALSTALHDWFEFDATATEVTTDPAEAFARRRGVCQDISHVMIAGLRSVGVPAGYVSGFLRTEPPEGRPRLEGADAMHAWVRAWCGREMGWIEIDPTNDMAVGEDHVAVAIGRDYADVAPVKGSLRSAGPHTTRHAVDMVPEVEGR